MQLIKVNSTDYINPDMVIRISLEQDETLVTEKTVGDDLLSSDVVEEVATVTKSWVIYTQEGIVKTDKKFNVKDFIRDSR